MRIAVIDSGVNLRHPHITSRTQRVVFTSDADGEDRLGHGTAVMAAIQEKAPSAQYWALKIFENTLRTRSSRLLAAIEWCIHNKMDLINLSLGTPNQESRAALETLIARAAEKQILLVSARHGGVRPVFPGSLPDVVGVELDPSLPRESWRVGFSAGNAMRFWASGHPRPLPGLPQERNLQGVSFAVANMSGFIAGVMETMPTRSCEAVHEALLRTSVCTHEDHATKQTGGTCRPDNPGLSSPRPFHHLD